MTKCRICGDRVCKSKAVYYSGNLKDLCVRCRKRELLKEVVIENIKKMPDNQKLSVG